MSFTVTSACVGCGACLATCPEAAIRVVRPVGGGLPEPRPVGGGLPEPPPVARVPLVVLTERCTGCAECAEVCPVEACVPLAATPRGG